MADDADPAPDGSMIGTATAGRRSSGSGPVLSDVASLRDALRGTRLAIALALIAAVALNVVLVRQTGQGLDEVADREFALVREARVLEGEVPEIISDGRGYLLSLDPHLVTLFEEDRAGAREALQRLRERVITDEGRRMVEAIGAQLEAVIAGVQRSIDLVQMGQVEAARDESAAATVIQRELFVRLDALVEREEALLRSRLDELQNQRLLGLIGSGVLLAFVGAVAVALLRRSERALETAQRRFQAVAAEVAAANLTLAGANEALQEAAAERTRAMADLRDAISQRETFLATTSHDLKNPLTAIKAQAQLLERRARRAGPEAAADVIAHVADGLAGIGAAATRMAAHIDDLLDVARIEMGRPLPLEVRPTDLVALVRQAVAEQQRTTERHRFRLDVEAPTLFVSVDAARIERVLVNLLANAVTYSQAGGEIVVEVDRRFAGERAEAVIAIRDAGGGIPAADLPRTFDRSSRGENGEGRFVGWMAGARHIVEAHGGTIDAASEDGRGATITVRLPVAGTTAGRAGAVERPWDAAADDPEADGKRGLVDGPEMESIKRPAAEPRKSKVV